MITTIDMSAIDSPAEVPACHYDRGEEAQMVQRAVQRETLLEVRMGNRAVFQMLCSISEAKDLVLGRLFTEGFIQGIEDVLSVDLRREEGKAVASVELTEVCRRLARAVSSTGPALVSITNCIAHGCSSPADSPNEAPAFSWRPSTVFALAEEFEEDRTSHARTRGVHSAYLATEGGVLCMREDIGRHNAFDKVIGWALARGIDLSECIVFTSGRVPTDMIAKAIKVGLPMLISKAAATSQTVELAKKCGLILICQATSRGFDVLSEGKMHGMKLPLSA